MMLDVDICIVTICCLLQRRLFLVWITCAVQGRLADNFISWWMGVLWYGAVETCNCSGHSYVSQTSPGLCYQLLSL